jgi:hypothetical protein
VNFSAGIGPGNGNQDIFCFFNRFNRTH